MTQPCNSLFDALADRHRRRLLFALLEENPQTDSPTDLDSPPGLDTADETDLVEYRHVHLPKLDDYDFIDWNPHVHSVERGGRFDEIEPVLRLLDANRDRLPEAE